MFIVLFSFLFEFYFDPPDALPPQMISTYTSSKITLTMQKPTCSFKKGYVHGFAVEFFLGQDPDCSDGENGT